MDNPFILLGLFIFFSFWWVDRSMKGWKDQQDKKLAEIKQAINALQTDFDEKFK